MTCDRAFGCEAVTICLYELSRSQLGCEHQIFSMQGKRSNRPQLDRIVFYAELIVEGIECLEDNLKSKRSRSLKKLQIYLFNSV